VDAARHRCPDACPPSPAATTTRLGAGRGGARTVGGSVRGGARAARLSLRPSFRAAALWRRDAELFAEVHLLPGSATRRALQPAPRCWTRRCTRWSGRARYGCLLLDRCRPARDRSQRSAGARDAMGDDAVELRWRPAGAPGGHRPVARAAAASAKVSHPPPVRRATTCSSRWSGRPCHGRRHALPDDVTLVRIRERLHGFVADSPRDSAGETELPAGVRSVT